MSIPPGLAERIEQLFPGSKIQTTEGLGPDAGVGATTAKAEGYGAPLRIELIEASGEKRTLVFRTATPNIFGHDRRSDRAQQMLLLADTAGSVPRHAAVLDVGAIGWNGSLVELQGCGEFYLITDFASGSIYAEDLRRLAQSGDIREIDLQRCDALALYLAELHSDKRPEAHLYRRSVRDAVGHGEGIYGVIDGYPDDVPAAPPGRLRAIEQACASYRWRLRSRESRLARAHGDFHPFNIVFQTGTSFSLLDASRGCLGDPADDVTALSINYVFFGLERPAAWKGALRVLWYEFFERYLQKTRDSGVFEAAPLYLAWRGLVLCNPRFYPGLSSDARDRLLRLVESTLDAGRLDIATADNVFA
jgi:aminoglycoside phosphotransferase (APT) family kinase protein